MTRRSWICRLSLGFALLNFIILPFRPRKTSEAYESIWTERGSPLLTNTEDLAAKLRERMDTPIKIAMRYGNPSVASALDAFCEDGIDEIIAVPLFPHYAASSFGSAAEHVMEEAGKRWNVPNIRVFLTFYDDPLYVEAPEPTHQGEHGRLPCGEVALWLSRYPEHQCTKSDTSGGKHCFQSSDCCESLVAANRHCYKAHCHATTRAVVERLGSEQGRP